MSYFFNRYLINNNFEDEYDEYTTLFSYPQNTVQRQRQYIPQSNFRIKWHIIMSWSIILSIGFAIARLLCNSTDYDSCSPLDPLMIIKDLLDMLVYSIPIFFFGYIHTEECNKFRRPYFIPIILVTVAGFSFLTRLSFLHVSIQSTSIQEQWTWATWLTIIVATLLVIALVVYHVLMAFKVRDYTKIKYGYKYLATIIVMILFYVGSYIYLIIMFPIVQIHLHHWFIFWFLSMFAHFNTHTSIICQAICIGIFVQGASSYGITDTIFDV
jgi:hypothetical protein